MGAHQLRRVFPEPADLLTDPARPLFRLMAVRAVAARRRTDPQSIARELFPRDAVVLRAASTSATTTNAAWAGVLSGSVVGAFLSGLVPRSAAAALFNACLRVDLDGANTVQVPRLSTNPLPGFVAEGLPIPVKQGVLALSPIGPTRKLIVIVPFTGELARHSAPSVEAVLRTGMSEAAGVALDNAVFSNAAADSARPAGLLNGVTPITAQAGGGMNALVGDLKAMVGAICDAGGGASIWFFANPRQAVVMKATVATNFDYPVIPTRALAAGTIVAVEVGGVASAFRDVPEIDASTETALHYEDTAPADLGTFGSPATVAAPSQSLFQTDVIALRLRLRCAWGAVQPGMAQVVNNVTW
jgi:hypothetical protein